MLIFYLGELLVSLRPSSHHDSSLILGLGPVGAIPSIMLCDADEPSIQSFEDGIIRAYRAFAKRYRASIGLVSGYLDGAEPRIQHTNEAHNIYLKSS